MVEIYQKLWEVEQMPEYDGKVRIGVELDNTNVRKGVQEAKKDISKLATEADDVKFDKAGAEAQELENDIEKVKKETEKLKEEADKTNFDKAKESVSKFKDNIEKAKKATSEIKEEADKAFGDVGNKAKAAGAAVLAGAAYSVKFNTDYKKAFNGFISQTGLSADAAKEYESVMQDIYKGNYGESIEDVGNAMAIVVQSARDLDPANIQNLTTHAIMLRDTFGFEVNESMRAANMLIDQFGVSGQEAFNLIALGAQNGLDKNGDLLDSINEYSVHYKQLGMGAGEMFNSFVNGAETGTFSVDKLGDAIKEFGIRTKDNSSATNDAFKALGLNAKGITKQFAKGGTEGRKAFDTVTKSLFSMNDEVKQNEIGVALFGTMWEDLGVDGMEALSNVNTGLDTTKDALGEISDVKYDDFGNELAGIKRIIEVDILQPLGAELTPAIGEFAGEIKENAPEIKDALVGIADKIMSFAGWVIDNKELVAGAIATMFTVKTASNVISFASSASSAFGSLVSGVGGAGAAIGALTNPVGLAVGGVALLGGAIYGAKKAAEEAEERFYNMGDSIKDSTKEFEEAKSKADLTEDYASKWRDLNEAINSGSLSGEALTKAESERKGIEEWFIANYGSYISAEDQKNGIREESVETLEKEAKLLADNEKQRLKNDLLDKKPNVSKLNEEIPQLIAKNKALGEEETLLLSKQEALLKLRNMHTDATREERNSAEWQKKWNKELKDFNETYDESYNGINNVIDASESLDDEIEANTKAQGENNKKIKDGTESMQDYADGCRTLIETELGTTLEDFASGYDIVKKAQEEVNTTGTISQETIDKLIETFPDMEESLQDPETAAQAVKDKMQELDEKLGNAKKTAEDFKVELNGLPKDISIDIKLNVPKLPLFAKGTRGAKRGLAVVNDGNGPELIEGRDGSFRMVESKGAALTYLNDGDRVYTAEQTRSIMRHVPHYAKGIGNYENVSIASFIDKVPEAFDKAYDELELRRDLGLISEKEFYEEAAKLRDQYFAEGSDKWWEQTEKINSWARDNEKKELDRRFKYGEISWKEYYEDLAVWRDKFYAEGSDEWLDITDDITEGTREQERKDLDRRFKMGKMSEKEYYEDLAVYRDKYFKEGSDEWWDCTLEIFDYNKQIEDNIVQSFDDALQRRKDLAKQYADDIVAIEDQLAEDIKQRYKELDEEKKSIISDKYSSFSLFDSPEYKNVSGEELWKGLNKQVNHMENFDNLLEKIKEKGGSDEFIEELRALGPANYSEVAAIARMNDGLFTRYIYDWGRKHKAAESLAGSDIKKAEEQADKDVKLLEDDAEKEKNRITEVYEEDVDQIITGLYDTAMEEIPKFSEIGNAIVEGIAEGISEEDGEISKALIGAVEKAVADTQDAAEINSPSKLTKEEIGYHLGDGATEGFIEKLRNMDVHEVYNSLMNALSSSVPAAVFSFESAIETTTGNESSSSNGVSEVILEVDGVKVGRALFPHITSENRRVGTSLVLKG